MELLPFLLLLMETEMVIQDILEDLLECMDQGLLVFHIHHVNDHHAIQQGL